MRPSTPDRHLTLAVSLLDGLRASRPSAPLAMIASRASATIALGAVRQLKLKRGPARAEIWSRVSRFLDEAPGAVIGYLGFDLVYPDSDHSPEDGLPIVDLWEPRTRVVLKPEGERAIEGAEDDIAGELATAASCERPQSTSLAPFVIESTREHERYLAAVSSTLRWIAEGGERLTVARRVELPDSLDPLGAAATPIANNDSVSRNLYLRTDDLELGGCSPELLVAGTAARFSTFKLSATERRDERPEHDIELARTFMQDPKNADEHASSIRSTARTLGSLGRVTVGPLATLERYAVRHGMTRIDVEPRAGTRAGDVLRAALPTGASPVEGGLRQLKSLEEGSRGPYYGLFVVREPNGTLHASQLLRCLFRANGATYTWVGAAVTALSTPDGEWSETLAKLADIRVWATR